jgi:crotonobetainyl-CoA:carnitine CoA-transferase CaiB-like acyl-CoA transferase
VAGHPSPAGEPGAAPLAGVRVLDVSHNLAGPLTGMHLADLGASVIKLERPSGDEWREHETVPGHPGRSRHYLQANRGKRAIAVDLTRPAGRRVAEALVADADVLVTNLRPGVPERLGVGWERCRELNPRLVYCAISAFGDRGPRGGARGYDIVLEAMCGFMPPSATPPGQTPAASPIPVHDTALPLLACTGILAALLERERSGLGQRVEVTLMGTAAALNAHSLVRLDDVAETPAPGFSRAFYRAFRTADGWIAVAAYAERLAHRLCELLGLPDLLSRERYRARADRVRHADEIVALLAPRFLEATTAEWDARLAEAGIPGGPVRERDELFADPQAHALGLLEEVEDPELGRVTMTAPLVRLSRTPGRMPPPGRHLGADTREVLAELGYGAEEIAALEREGTVLARAQGAA